MTCDAFEEQLPFESIPLTYQCCYDDRITEEAQKELRSLPLPIQGRGRNVFRRLENWPAVSGAKPLRKELVGSYRIRTGDFRIVFKVVGDIIEIWKIGDRRDVYLD